MEKVLVFTSTTTSEKNTLKNQVLTKSILHKGFKKSQNSHREEKKKKKTLIE
jgi:hypothetical protein